jgi:hypothetical protein
VKRALVLLLLLLACARTNIDKQHWQRMSGDEKALYVRALLGHEKVKERKGGNDRMFHDPPEQYVQRIDDAYAKGETRDVEAVFESMGTRK